MNHYDRQVQELLRSEKLRDALGRQLGCEIVKPGESQPDDLPIVAVLVPCYDHPKPRMTDAFQQMVRASQGVCKVFPGAPVSSSVIHWSRNWLIAELIKSQKPWTHVLFMDDDMVPAPDALVKMLSHKQDIVAALCTRRVDPPIPNIRHFLEKTGEYQEMWTWAEGLQEVGAAGTGMMLISRKALEKVAAAWWNCEYEQEFYGLGGDLLQKMQAKRVQFFDKNANAYWFRFLPSMDGSYEMGEDVSFCFMASRYAKLKIYCDTTVQPGHVGDYVYSIQDFLPYRQACIQQAIADGKYVPQPEHEKEILVVG